MMMMIISMVLSAAAAVCPLSFFLSLFVVSSSVRKYRGQWIQFPYFNQILCSFHCPSDAHGWHSILDDDDVEFIECRERTKRLNRDLINVNFPYIQRPPLSAAQSHLLQRSIERSHRSRTSFKLHIVQLHRTNVSF